MRAGPADRNKMLGQLIREIKWCPSDAAVPGLIETFNALSLPHGYIYVDPDQLVHVVVIRCTSYDELRIAETQNPCGEIALSIHDWINNRMGSSVSHTADVIWRFDPTDRSWLVTKDRTGDFLKHSPYTATEGGQDMIHGQVPVQLRHQQGM